MGQLRFPRHLVHLALHMRVETTAAFVEHFLVLGVSSSRVWARATCASATSSWPAPSPSCAVFEGRRRVSRWRPRRSWRGCMDGTTRGPATVPTAPRAFRSAQAAKLPQPSSSRSSSGSERWRHRRALLRARRLVVRVFACAESTLARRRLFWVLRYPRHFVLVCAGGKSTAGMSSGLFSVWMTFSLGLSSVLRLLLGLASCGQVGS